VIVISVMAGLDPAIHGTKYSMPPPCGELDGRVTPTLPGHDEV